MDKKILLRVDAIFFYIASIGGFLMSLLLIIFHSYFSSAFTSILEQFLPKEIVLPNMMITGIIIFVVIIYLIMSFAYFFAAKYLWNYKKIGGIIALVILILGFLGSWTFLFAGYIGVVCFLFEIMLLTFLILGWKKLS